MRPYANRKIKDKLFRDIFSKDKTALLQIYNALNSSSYQDWEQLEVITIDDVLSHLCHPNKYKTVTKLDFSSFVAVFGLVRICAKYHFLYFC